MRMLTGLRGAAALIHGVEGAEDVRLATARLDAEGVCYTKRLSPSADDPLIDYMRCEVWAFGGATHPGNLQSFLWVGGEFRGDGYLLSATADGGLTDRMLWGLLTAANAETNCDKDPCDLDSLSSRAGTITTVCCSGENGCSDTEPWPTVCSPECMAAWTPFWTG